MSNTFYTSCAHVFFPSLTSKGPVYCNILPVTLLALHILASPTLSSYWINWYMLFHTQSAMTAYASSSSDCGATGNLSHTRSSSSNSLTTLCALSAYSLWISLDFHLLGSVRTPISEFYLLTQCIPLSTPQFLTSLNVSFKHLPWTRIWCIKNTMILEQCLFSFSTLFFQHFSPFACFQSYNALTTTLSNL